MIHTIPHSPTLPHPSTPYWADVQTLLQMVEGVLRHVGQPHVGVPVHLALLLLHLGSQDANERRLARAVGADDGDARAQPYVQRDVSQCLIRGSSAKGRYIMHSH